jgi:transposase
MKLIKLQPHYNSNEIKANLDKQTDIRNFQDWQIINAINTNPKKKAEEIAIILSVSKRKIYDIVAKYNKYGKKWKSMRKWGGRRESNAYLTLDEEKELFANMTKKALQGLILTYHDLKKHIEDKLGLKVSDDYIWVLFKRNGWSKKVPYPEHPFGNKDEQEDFKKKLKKIWQPNY